MVGEEFGWGPLDGLAIAFLILKVLLIVIIPGFLLSLALFPKRDAMSMSERMGLSFGLGLAPAFIIMLFNMALGVNVNYVSSVLIFLFLCISGVLGFLYRGGSLNLVEWYRSKEAAGSE